MALAPYYWGKAAKMPEFETWSLEGGGGLSYGINKDCSNLMGILNHHQMALAPYILVK